MHLHNGVATRHADFNCIVPTPPYTPGDDTVCILIGIPTSPFPQEMCLFIRKCYLLHLDWYRPHPSHIHQEMSVAGCLQTWCSFQIAIILLPVVRVEHPPSPPLCRARDDEITGALLCESLGCESHPLPPSPPLPPFATSLITLRQRITCRASA